MDYVWLILRTDLRSLLAVGRKGAAMKRLGLVGGTLAYAGLAGAVGYGAYRLFALFRGYQGIPEVLSSALEANILSGVTLFSLVMVFISGLQSTYKIIFESDDIGFLMAQPVPIEAIFAAKFVSAFASIAAVAAPFGLPVWVAYGLVRKAGALFPVAAAILLALLLLLAHSAVSFVLLLAMRYLPGRKMKQLFVGLTAVLGVMIVLLSQMLSSQIQRTPDTAKIVEMLSKGSLAGPWYLPSSWMVGSAVALAGGKIGAALPGAFALAASAGCMSVAAVRLSKRWFTAGWSGRTEEAGLSSKRRVERRRTASPKPRGSYFAILGKDLRLLVRDPLVWYNLAIGVIVIGFFIFNTSSTMMRGQPEGVPAGEDIEVMGALALFMPVMMGSVTGAQTGGVSISREGSSFWIVRGNPVAASEFFWAKMTYALLPPSALLVFSVVAMRIVAPFGMPLWLSLLLGGAMVLTVSSLQILLDIFFPDFTLKIEFGSSRSGRGTGKLLTTMFSSMGAAGLLTFLATLPATPLGARLFPGLSQSAVALIVRAGIVGLGLAVLLGTRYFGVKRLERVLTDM